jgi:hypothetical protein
MHLTPFLAAAAAAATITAAVLAQAPAPAPAPAANPAQPAIPTQAKALLVFGENDFKDVWIELAEKGQFRYRDTETAIDRKIEKIAATEAIFFYEPAAYTAARDLYQGRRFEEAKELFGRIRESLKGLRDMPNNHSTLSGFYELECMRHLGDLAGLVAALDSFRPESLTRAHHRVQYDLYTLWSAVHTKSWDRLDKICVDRRKEAMPGYQRAQVAYCHGLALEGLKKPIQALNAYAGALVADYGDSESIVHQAALNSLRVYLADPEVQLAIKLWGTDDEDPNAAGRFRLLEAAALANTYQDLLAPGKPLPSEYKELLKFKEKAQQ